LGLDRPAVRVIAHRAEGRAEAAFGDENPAGSGVYVQRDDGKVFLTATTAKSTFAVSLDDVRRKEFIDFKSEAVTDIAITHRGRSVRLNREGDDWRIVDPARAADPETVSSLLSRLRALRATGFADTVEQRDALRVSGKPRTEVAITAGSDVVRVAFLQAADGSLYARTSGDTLYRLNESVVSALPLDASALRDLRVVRAAFDDVRAVEVERGPERYRVTRAQEGWELDGRRLAEEGARAVDAMVRSFTALRGEAVAVENAAGLPAKAFASPAARVVLRGADDRPLAAVTISEASGDRRYAFSESPGPVFWVARATLDRILSKSALEPHVAPAS
jgi:hypothetical protein